MAPASSRPPLSLSRHNATSLPGTLPIPLPASLYSTRFPPGHSLDAGFVRRYGPGHELGVGGHGFVLSVHDNVRRCKCAVKFVIKKGLPKSAWCHVDGETMLVECRIMLLIDHPGVVKLLDYFEDDLYVYLVQEMAGTPWTPDTKALFSFSCPDDSTNVPLKPPRLGPRRPSHDLFECLELLPSKRFSEEDARYIFFQLANVVQYLESLHIYHRDIKDENVLVDEKLTIKLTDFGAAILEEGQDPPPTYTKFFGTLAYVSPEVTLKKPYRPGPVEVWSMGSLLAHLLTGRSPFPEMDDALNGRIRLHIPSGSIVTLSEPCLDMIRSCLHPTPELRPTIQELLAHPWLKDCRPRARTQ